MEQDKLLPCPFCGVLPVFHKEKQFRYGYIKHPQDYKHGQNIKPCPLNGLVTDLISWNIRPQSHAVEKCKCDPPGSGEEYCKGDCFVQPQPNMNIKIGGTCKVCNRPIGMCACSQTTQTPAGKKLGVEDEKEALEYLATNIESWKFIFNDRNEFAARRMVKDVMDYCSKFGQRRMTLEDIFSELCLECGNKERGDLLNSKEKEKELWRYAQAIFNAMEGGKDVDKT